MDSDSAPRLTVRDAQSSDVPALTTLKWIGTEAIHHDRLRDAHSPDFRYLVLSKNAEIIGFVCLVFRRPSHWSDADELEHLPQLVDLQVSASQRGQGVFAHRRRVGSERVSVFPEASVRRTGYCRRVWVCHRLNRRFCVWVHLLPSPNSRGHADLWRLISPDHYTDSELHLDAEGWNLVAKALARQITSHYH